MKLEDYTYNLPEELIADKPPKNRGESRLIEINRATGQIRDNLYKNVLTIFKRVMF